MINKNRICILNSYYRIQIEYTSKGIQVFNIKRENKNIFNHDKYIFYNQIQTDGISANLLFIKKDNN